MEVNFDVEFLISVDSTSASRHVVWVRATAHIVKHVRSASAGSIARMVIAEHIWGVTLVSSRMESILVCLHDIELGAEIASNTLSVTILPWVHILVN